MQSATLPSRGTGPPLPFPFLGGPGPTARRSPAPNTWRAPAGPPPPPLGRLPRGRGRDSGPESAVRSRPGFQSPLRLSRSLLLPFHDHAGLLFWETWSFVVALRASRRAALPRGAALGPGGAGPAPEARSPAADARLGDGGRWRRRRRGARPGQDLAGAALVARRTPSGAGRRRERRQSSEVPENKEAESHTRKTCEVSHVPECGAWWQSREAMRWEAACLASLVERPESSSSPHFALTALGDFPNSQSVGTSCLLLDVHRVSDGSCRQCSVSSLINPRAVKLSIWANVTSQQNSKGSISSKGNISVFVAVTDEKIQFIRSFIFKFPEVVRNQGFG